MNEAIEKAIKYHQDKIKELERYDAEEKSGKPNVVPYPWNQQFSYTDYHAHILCKSNPQNGDL